MRDATLAPPPLADEEADGIPCWKGNPSIIMLNYSIYDPILHSYEAFTTDPSARHRERLTAAYVALGKTLVHERAHVVHNARWGPSDRCQMPFEKQLLCEDGFDWERTVFKGIIDVDQARGPILLHSWPAPRQVEPYAKGNTIGVGILAPWDTLKADSDVFYRISSAFIASLFRKKFWEETVLRRGVKAFQHPKLLGMRSARSSVGSATRCCCEKCDAFNDYILRCNMCSNGPIAPKGACVKQVRDGRVRLMLERLSLTLGNEASATAPPTTNRLRSYALRTTPGLRGTSQPTPTTPATHKPSPYHPASNPSQTAPSSLPPTSSASLTGALPTGQKYPSASLPTSDHLGPQRSRSWCLVRNGTCLLNCVSGSPRRIGRCCRSWTRRRCG